MKYILALCLALFAALPSYAGEMSQAPADLSSMQSAALLGDSNAQLNLGKYYATSHNAAPDLEQAAKWYRKAADQGNAEAQYRLGDFYYSGKGQIKQDYAEAYFWFVLASRAGSRVFATDRDETARHLTADQIAAIQKRADDWRPVSRN